MLKREEIAAVFKLLQRVRDAGAVDGETHVVSLNIVEVAAILDERNRLRDLVQCLVDNDPDETISDAGHTVLEHWRHDARTALRNYDTSPTDPHHGGKIWNPPENQR